MLSELVTAAAVLTQPQTAEAARTEAYPVILVTGERVKRSVKDTPSSVSVVAAQDIDLQPVDRIEQVLAGIANVQIGHGSEGPAIRGLDTTGPLQALPAFLGGNRPRTTIVIDGRPITYNEFVFGVEPTWDLARVEVFRSPQTTTQGQNSIAGAIFVFTEDPTFDPEYRARATVGNFHTRQLSAVASHGLNSDVALRIAGDVRYSRTTSKLSDSIVGAEPNHDVYGLVRAKLLALPAAFPGLKLGLTYAHNASQAPQIVGVDLPFKRRADPTASYGVFRIRVDSLTARAAYDRGPVTATAVLSAGDSLSKRLAASGLGQARTSGRDWSGEAVAGWSAGPALRLTGGFSRRHTALDQHIDLSRLNGISHFDDGQDATGLFGEADITFAQGAKLTAGLRYQRDSQRRVGAFETSGGAIDLRYDKSFHAWLPKVSLAYDFSPSLTAGVLVERAYNPGGTTLRFDIGQPDNFDAEYLWDRELFLRASFAGGRLSVNANAFHYNMRNAQRSKDIPILAPTGQLVGFGDLFNVPKATSYGAEAEFEWRPSTRLHARLGVGLLRTRIIKAGTDYPQFQGNEFDRSPHLTGSASVQWRPTDRLQLSALVRHHSSYSSDPENRPLTEVGPGTIADARAAYGAKRLNVFAYARNLFDTFSIVTRDATSATLEDPREVGIGVETRF